MCEAGRNLPLRLFVYECRGPQSPRSEPAGEGFLGLWPEPPYFYLFFAREARREVERWIASQAGWSLGESYSMDYDQWQQISPGSHPVGPFLIQTAIPDFDFSSFKDPPGPGQIPLFLNPGLVFGSGLHPTTRGCLLTIASLFGLSSPPRTVVDLGTGTGILAVACGLLGADRVRAMDCVPLAARVARENVRANGLAKAVDVIIARELTVFQEPADLLLMNIEWPFLKRALEAGDWRAYGKVVLSGFLEKQWDELRTLLPSERRILLHHVIEDWVTLALC